VRLLITGAGGMLARAVAVVARSKEDEVIALDRASLDITDEETVLARIVHERPDVVFQGAAYTDVDRAEAEPAKAAAVNVQGTRNVARACQKVGAVLVYPSTDYVFDGSSDRPYLPSDQANPVNEYGRTKWLGELAAAESGRALVVRTSWRYGAGGKNFVDTIARIAVERESLEVVDDQLGRPSWTESVACTIHALLKAGAVGTFHASDGGEPVSWAGLAQEIIRCLSLRTVVDPIPSERLGRRATRPSYSVLDLTATAALTSRQPADWRRSLSEYLNRKSSS
jgi:dTDP-4-dehydrorhamnose reductase